MASSRESDINKQPDRIPTKPPPSLNYASRPHIGDISTTGSNRSSGSNIATTAAARGIVNMDDFDPDSNSSAIRTNWNVEDGTLRPLPPLHPPLDPVSTAFVYDASPSVIAARVSDCLRERSIMTEFDDDAATANAMTANRVHFIIRLHRGGGPSSPFSHGVIIEIQRLRGDAMTFHQSSRAILSAAQGDTNAARIICNNLVPNNGMGLSLDIPIRGVLTNDDSKERDSADILMALEIDWSLIKKDRMDANILGWESLALLTDGQGSGRSSALVASRVVLGLAPCGNQEDEGEDERYAEIHASVISLVRDGRMIGSDALYDNEHNEGKNDADYFSSEEAAAAVGSGMYPYADDTEHIVVQRSLAIRSMANSLEVVADAGDARFFEHVLPNLVTHENIIPSLLEEVAQSVLPNNPFNASDATHSARALRVLFENSQEARNVANAREALSILRKASLVGRSRHAALEQEAERAYQALNAGAVSVPVASSASRT